MKKQGLNIHQQKHIKVFYDLEEVGEYFADICVEDEVVLELKAAERIREEHECQLINYLKATEMEVGLLLNFGKDPEFSRKVYSNTRKSWLSKK